MNRVSVLAIKRLSYELPDKLLYEDSELTLNKGEHLGLTGKNGVGKSTLFKIIMGDVVPDSGDIKWQKNIEFAYLEQQLTYDENDTMFDYLKSAFKRLYKMDEDIQKLYEEYAETYDDELIEKAGKYQEELEKHHFYTLESDIEKVATGLGLDAIGLDKKVSELSGGQRSKVSLAKLLLQPSDVFLLDEPTNYLDTHHIDWLANYLTQMDASYMVISHDHEFLNRVTNCICDIDFQRLTKYSGSLEAAMKQKHANAEYYQREYDKQQKEINKLENYVRKYKAGSRSNMAKSREKQLNRIERLTPPTEVKPGKFQFPFVMTHSAMMIEVHNLAIGYKKPLLPNISMTVLNGEKIAISGFNGIGKSTLLKTLIGQVRPLAGDIELNREAKINYFSQDLDWENPMQSAFDYIKELYPKLNNKEVRRYLSRSGIVDENVTKAIHQLSGGEQTKVKLCGLTLKSSNLLILDEPTNHLDAATKEALKRALQDYKGTILVVSHEKEFADGLVDKTFDIETQTFKA